MTRFQAILICGSLIQASFVFAADEKMNSSMEGAMHSAMQRMHEDMQKTKMTGNAEADYMQMMIPHHQGALDMSKIYLKHGKEPNIRARAEKVIRDQTKEIKEMEKLIKEVGASKK